MQDEEERERERLFLKQDVQSQILRTCLDEFRTLLL